MATYTPNYNLSKPESTDDMTDFFADYGDNMDIIDSNMGGGGSGSLDAVETTSNDYAQLPQTDKDDPTKIYFLNDTQSSEVVEPVDFSTFVNSRESSMTISVVNGELVYTWNGGSSIRANSFYPTAIPSTAKKIKYKLTTGASSYYNNVSADNRWRICIGVKASYSTADIYSTDGNWLVNAIYTTVNDVIEGELDLSSISSDCYLMLTAKGWNLTWNEISVVSDVETTGETSIKYKDITYGLGNVIYLPAIYSTEEREVGCWTDGKPLYQKTVVVSNPTMGSRTNINDPTFSNCTMRELKGYVTRDASAYGVGNIIYPLNTYEDSAYNDYVVFDEYLGKLAYLLKMTGNTVTELAITFRYTKTTDTAGSGTWTPSGANAVHYSENEQVMGTWLGDTLYGKLVVTSGSVPTGATEISREVMTGYDWVQYTK